MALHIVAAAAGVGIVAGPWLRGLVFAHSVGFRAPLRCRCPQCGSLVAPIAARGLAAAAPPDGRCPACRRLLGLPAGAVELLAAVSLAVLALSAPSVWVLAAWSWAGLFGIALALVDAAVHRLPSILTAAATGGALILLTVTAVVTGDYPALLRAIGCAVVLSVIYLALVLSDRTALNRGDAQLAPLIGACVGWISISAVWTATVAWILFAGAFVLPAVLTHRIALRDAIPLGPFILLGALTAIALASSTS